jgi:hypothetical protein
MARTKTKPTKLQQDQIRSAIQATQLVKRLQNYALGEKEANSTDEDVKPVELDKGRLKAIEILLRKSLPDLSTVQLQGDDDAPLVTKIKMVAVSPT